MPEHNHDQNADIPALMVTNVAGNTRLTVRVDMLSLWLLAGLGPFAQTSTEHPLAAGRPMAHTDSDNPLDRWEVEQVAANLHAMQQARFQLTDSTAKNLLVRLYTAAQHVADDAQAVGIAVEEDELKSMLNWLNRTYVRLRTGIEGQNNAVGQAQSAAVFLGLEDDADALGLPEVTNAGDAAQMMVAFALAQSVEMLGDMIYA